jgi:opacity protein-like surface antigen
MRRVAAWPISVAVGSLLLLPWPALASEASRFDLYGGYAQLRSDVPPRVLLDRGSQGWGAAVAVNVNGWLGLEGAAGGHYGSAIHTGLAGPSFTGGSMMPTVYYFLAGPELTFHLGDRVAPFVHALFGVARERVGDMGVDFVTPDSRTGFASEWGGGLDVTLHDRWALRLIEADYLRTSALGTRQDDVRLSAGIVLRLARASR